MAINKSLLLDLKQVFQEFFEEEGQGFFSPGRINFLGEHIDYNDGFVLPAAIHLGVYGIASKRNDAIIKIYAADFKEWLEIDTALIAPSTGWKNYPLSVLNQFRSRGVAISGFNMVMGADLPVGAGLSSSAAVEGLIGTVVNTFENLGWPQKRLALLNQAAEHDYPGVNCGIMDQFANMLGKKDHIVRIDCLSKDVTYLPLKMDDFSVVMVNSCVEHQLTAGAYNERRSQCVEGLRLLEGVTGKNSFRAITPYEVAKAKNILPDIIYQRCLYVTEEISRTNVAATYLQSGNMEGLGELMYQTHEGLSTLYDVSLPQLDFLVSYAQQHGVTGARLMGGGFGGCTINLIKKELVPSFSTEIMAAYKNSFNIHPQVFTVSLSDGAHVLASNLLQD